MTGKGRDEALQIRYDFDDNNNSGESSSITCVTTARQTKKRNPRGFSSFVAPNSPFGAPGTAVRAARGERVRNY
ncbi:hypothetical protein C4D60_Mb10t12870 [Musa balbisiana]|uniref:Uncharacterized protein n=1 Tax=Musa balbisiana TaxID=52838 RepID=A0A4S8IWN0_MUSBA|nr:hypothetical protein C4D60_Mb10t12870 [Musa balbisiana]